LVAAKRTSNPRRRSVAPKSTRVRRTAEEAQNAILDAAERRLREAGPQGIRLQEVAADVGVSHPAILHHFKNREALIEAVVTRTMSQLEAELVRAATAGDVGEGLASDMLERVFEVLGDRGYGRIMAWVLLSGHRPVEDRSIRTIAEAVHARRLLQHADRPTKPSFEDSLFIVLLAALTMFGDAVAGPEMRISAGLGPDANGKPFRRFLARLLLDRLDAPEPNAS
jgi:AcrR family transcriptional regulator